MSRGAYVFGFIELVVLIAALGCAAWRTRAVLAPNWVGTPARLAEAVIGLSLFVVVAELLGVVGLLEEIPLLLAAVLTAVGAEALYGRRAAGARPNEAGDVSSNALVVAGAMVGALVLARWLIPVQGFLEEGMWAFDTMAYHMPLAAGIAQSGSITSLHQLDPLDIVWFYPENSELFHSAGIVLMGTDILSPALNVGWLGLALVAAWCIGRPYRVGPASAASVGIVLVSPLLLARQPGNAHSDIVGIALLLAGAAILLNAYPGEGPGPRRPTVGRLGGVVIAALAIGLAIGTKLSLVAPIGALSIGLVAIAPAGARGRVALAWFLPMLATGGFWFLRNLIASGNPLPFFDHLGPIHLPAPDRVVELPQDFSVSHYLGDGRVWDDFFLPGLDHALGTLWPLVLAFGIGGALLSLIDRGAPVRRVLGITALAGMVGYLFTPLSAAGPEGSPAYFDVNLRWLTPSLALGLALLPTLPWLRRGAAPRALLGVLALALIFTAGLRLSGHDRGLGWALAIGLATGLLALGLALGAPRVRPLEVAVSLGLVAILAVSAYHRPSMDYLRQRYTAVWPGLYVAKSFSWANGVSGARIGLAGTTAAFLQYGYYGRDSSNVVRYIGHAGPRGAFNPIQSCPEWRETVNRGHYDYLVTSPTIAPGSGTGEGFAPELTWLAGDPAAQRILVDGPTAVFRLTGALDPNGCPPDVSEGLPPLLQPHDPA